MCQTNFILLPRWLIYQLWITNPPTILGSSLTPFAEVKWSNVLGKGELSKNQMFWDIIPQNGKQKSQ